MKKQTTSRRQFIASSSMVAAGVAIGNHALNAMPLSDSKKGKDKIRMGFIGVGNRGTQLLHSFMKNEDVVVTALCDVYEPYLTRDYSKVHPEYVKLGGRIPKMGEDFGKEVKRYHDFRDLLADKQVDAVCIATPEHWHAIQMIQAVDAGKDVYVEKPLTITIKEGREMVKAQQRTNKIVQVGLNRRASKVYQGLAPKIQAGKIGQISTVRAIRVSNLAPDGIGNFPHQKPPADFDWDMWLGPRAFRPYQYNIAPYKFRWWGDYSSQIANWGVHFLDALRWMLGEKAPVSVSVQASKRVLTHDGDIPDTMQVLYELPSGTIMKFMIHEASGGGVTPLGNVELFGTKGNLGISDFDYKIVPSKPGQFQTWDKLIEPEEYAEEKSTRVDTTSGLIRNFLDCVKS
ncbi:MAG: Gfo/Idh/MocA family oxidoreductase, partial [Cyclobacteriaceae bacterium]|nr:Gfo/Idh/MocA family oxidoreductase [Cyclobacteriaceae bacterium]